MFPRSQKRFIRFINVNLELFCYAPKKERKKVGLIPTTRILSGFLLSAVPTLKLPAGAEFHQICAALISQPTVRAFTPTAADFQAAAAAACEPSRLFPLLSASFSFLPFHKPCEARWSVWLILAIMSNQLRRLSNVSLVARRPSSLLLYPCVSSASRSSDGALPSLFENS